MIELHRSFHHTKILATHDLDMALDVCGRALVMHQGVVRADGPTAELFRDDALMAECCLERPLRLQGCPFSSRRS